MHEIAAAQKKHTPHFSGTQIKKNHSRSVMADTKKGWKVAIGYEKNGRRGSESKLFGSAVKLIKLVWKIANKTKYMDENGSCGWDAQRVIKIFLQTLATSTSNNPDMTIDVLQRVCDSICPEVNVSNVVKCMTDIVDADKHVNSLYPDPDFPSKPSGICTQEKFAAHMMQLFDPCIIHKAAHTSNDIMSKLGMCPSVREKTMLYLGMRDYLCDVHSTGLWLNPPRPECVADYDILTDCNVYDYILPIAAFYVALKCESKK